MWPEHEQGSRRQRDWNEVDGENYEVDSRDMIPQRVWDDGIVVAASGGRRPYVWGNLTRRPAPADRTARAANFRRDLETT